MKYLDKQKFDKNDSYEEYVLQLIDLPLIYKDIQQSFEQKNPDDLISSLENLKSYLRMYAIESPEQFQNILFPVLKEICENKENEDLILYGLQFISFIMKNDVYINYIPLFTQPNFFDFCFAFLSNSNHLIIFWALDNIENFVHLHADARDYALAQLTVDSIINNFIKNTDFFNEEPNEYDIQVKSSLILRCYTLYPIDEENADQIFNICNTILENEDQYVVLYENALWICYNLIQQYRKYVTKEFIDNIDRFYFDRSPKTNIPTLKILCFLISRDYTPPNSISKNFISLFSSNDKKVGKLSLECLYLILHKQEEGAIKNLINNDFLNEIGHLLSDQQFETKVKAAKAICILIKEGGSRLCNLICHKGYIHDIFILFELEMDEVTISTLRSLIEICGKMNYQFVPRNQDEINIFEELIQSESEEISNLATYFVKKYSTRRKVPDPDISIQINKEKKRKGPNIRIKEKEQIPKRNSMRLWQKPTEPVNDGHHYLSEFSHLYYQQNDSVNEEEDLYDHENYDY